MKRHFLTILLVLTATFAANAQVDVPDSLSVPFEISPEKLVSRADSLHRACRFLEARDLYEKVISESADSVLKLSLEDRRLCSENGVVMSGFVYEPTVVAKHVFSLDEFFLYYPMEDRSWVPVPNVLDSLGDNIVRATYIPSDEDVLYFSKKGRTGVRNIFSTTRENGLWTLPALINEGITTTSDDIFPTLSADGTKLYFASSGLYGVGGYDIYVSTWNEARKDWGEPVNLGFPFSSPADDFLYMDTPDGKYTIFASNRECAKDSVCVYVLEFDNVPVRKEILDEERLSEILSLRPSEDQTRIDNGSSVSNDIPENDDTRRYMDKMNEVKALKDSVNLFSAALDSQRQAFASSDDDDERARLTESILNGEMQLPMLRKALDKATAELQKIEMDFLFKGVIIDPDKLAAKADRKVVAQSAAYTFTRMNPGSAPKMEFEKPISRFDYSFKVLPEGQYAEDQTLPGGVVYQIHFITLPTAATKRQLKGLSPVYETVNSNGNHFYTVGLFTRYADALDNLNTVKGVGFRSASIVAFRDGKSCSLTEAKANETADEFWQVIVNTGSDTLPSDVSAAIRGYCSKDISKRYSDGIVLYVVSSFNRKEEAEELAAVIRAVGIDSVSVSRIED